ncbi:MAG: aspartyl protease family protein [Bergeyella sp.]
MKFLYIFLLFVFTGVKSQEGFTVKNGEKAVIPFKLINNLIFIPVNINGVDLTFLLDSGVNESILFSLENKDIDFQNVEKITFSGLGENFVIEGLKSVSNQIKIGKSLEDNNHTVYIILDQGINFSDQIGIPVNGIIGYQFFRNYPVQINYLTKKITVYNSPELFKKKTKNFEEFPITLELNKPYISADVEMTRTKKSSKMLIDLGNSDALWLFPTLIKDFVYNRPNIDDYLGRGFNGDIFGKRSRIHGLYLGKYNFVKPLAAMPYEYSIQHLKLVNDRKGSIGSEILRRFTVIFNYPENTIFLKPNKHYNDPFLFNKSGLEIRHDGMSWERDIVNVVTQKVYTDKAENPANFQYKFVLKPVFSVAGCRKDSPCDKADIKKGDRIISINGKYASNLTLEKLNNMMKDDEGKYVNFQLERNSVIIKRGFYLEDPIPYQEQENP